MALATKDQFLTEHSHGGRVKHSLFRYIISADLFIGITGLLDGGRKQAMSPPLGFCSRNKIPQDMKGKMAWPVEMW